MKIKINRERPGKVLVEAPRSIFIYDDNGGLMGEIEFCQSEKHGFEVNVYTHVPRLSVGVITRYREAEG